MIVIVLVVLGLCFGSFVNALVWRLHEQASRSKKKKRQNLSIINGRSMCPECGHELGAKDLVPVVSWLALGGKCRYCKKPISPQYPLVELGTAVLFVTSYLYWPMPLEGKWSILFIFWLVFLVGFMALAVYDLRWYLLPNKLVYPLLVLAVLQVFVTILLLGGGWQALREATWGLLIGGGIFYLLFQLSDGRWIGGGDVKLGAVLGIIVGGPQLSLLLLFLASLFGSLITVPLLAAGKTNRRSHVPFGPFLILATITVKLFGFSLINWYKRHLLIY